MKKGDLKSLEHPLFNNPVEGSGTFHEIEPGFKAEEKRIAVVESTNWITTQPLSTTECGCVGIAGFGFLKILNPLFYSLTNGVIRDPIIFFLTFLKSFNTFSPVKFDRRFQRVDDP